MRKYISIMLILTLTISLIGIFPVKAANGLSGSGTEKDRYLIYTSDDFLKIKNEPDAHYMIMQDISLPSGFVPFELSGSVIGYKEDDMPKIDVSIFSESSTSSNPLGLFSKLTGTGYLKNLHLTGNITGTDYVGGFVGNSSSTAPYALYNCINEATIRGNSYVGGLVSYHTAGKIENCINLGNVYGKQYVGGIAAFVNTVYINLCQNFGNITASLGSVGGIAGRNYGYINECFNQGNIKGGTHVGGIIGIVNGKRDSTELYNVGTVTSTSSASNNDCGGIIGGLSIGGSRYINVKGAYNLGDVISAGKNFNPIAPSYTPFDNTNYINISDGIYVSSDKKEDFYEGTVAVYENDSNLNEKINNISKKYEVTRNNSNLDFTGDILSQLGAEMVIYNGYKKAAYINKNNQAVMENMDENDPMVVSRIVNGTLMVPVSFVCRAFGAGVLWKPELSEVVITREAKEIVFKINERVAYLNGVKTDLGETAFIERGRTFVPFRVLCEFFEKNVFWHDSGIVVISSNPVVPSQEYIEKAKGLWIVPAEQISSRVKSAKPGDELIIANGIYKDVQIDIDFTATETLPLTLRAETPGLVEFTGTSKIIITGRYIRVKDLYFNEAINDSGTVVLFSNSHYSELSNCYFYKSGHHTHGQNPLVMMASNSKFNKVHHNTIERPQSVAVAVIVEYDVPRELACTDNIISHNYFLDVRKCSEELPGTPSGNGLEVIRLGASKSADFPYSTIVEYNRFENIVGDGGEGICLKSDGNIVRYNTFTNSPMSGLSMRYNRDSVVVGNFWFGTKYGMRAYGGGHTFKGNYTYNDARSGLMGHGGSGEGDSITADTCAFSNSTFEENITIYPNHAGIILGDNFNTEAGTINGSNNIKIKNNIYYLDKGRVVEELETNNIEFEGNLVNLSGTAVMGTDKEGFTSTDIPLVFDGEIYLPENLVGKFDKQGLISVSECGPTERWWEQKLRYTPKYFFDIEPEDAPESITPEDKKIYLNINEQFDLKGLTVNATYNNKDLFNNTFDTTYEKIGYKVSEGDFNISDDLKLTANSKGQGKIQLTYKGLTTNVSVEAIDSSNEFVSSNFKMITGSKWTDNNGVMQSPQVNTIAIDYSKILTGNYEISCDVTLNFESGSGTIGGGIILGYKDKPNMEYYMLRFAQEGSTIGGIYYIDGLLSSSGTATCKLSEFPNKMEKDKTYNVKIRVNGNKLIVLIDDKISAFTDRFNPQGNKIGFASFGANTMTVSNCKITDLKPSVYSEEIKEIKMEVKKIDSTIAYISYEELEQPKLYYRMYRFGNYLNDSNTASYLTDVSIKPGRTYTYDMKAFDEYGNLVGQGSKSIEVTNSDNDEFFTISNVLVNKTQSGKNDPWINDKFVYRGRGLREGMTIFSDRAYTITDLPDRFKDCGFIKNNYSYRSNPKLTKAQELLKFDINRSATVYVIGEFNGETPAWLSDWNFEMIDSIRSLDETLQSKCFSKHFDVKEGEKTTVMLGGIPGIAYNYLIIVKPDIMPEYVEINKVTKGSF